MSANSLGMALIVGGFVLVIVLTFFVRQGQRLLWERDRLPALTRLLALMGGILVVLGVWYIGHALNPVGPTRVPSPQQTLIEAFSYLMSGGYLDLLASTGRVVFAFTLAAVISISIAFALALHSINAAAFSPPLSFIRYIPPTAFTALLVIYFGVGEGYKAAVIFVGVFFFNYRMTMDIIEDFDIRYLELARLTGEGHRKKSTFWLISKTVIPASWPRIWDTLRINLSFAWTFLVVAETVGANYGLGSDLYLSQRFFRVERVYAIIVLFGVIGLISDAAMAYMKKILFRWHSDATTK